MSGPILFGESLVTLPSARIARRDVVALRCVDELLCEAKRIRSEADAQTKEAVAKGYEAGQKAARDEFASALAESLSALADGFAKENERRTQEVSQAAMEVVTKLIGQHDAPEIVAGLAEKALASAGAGSDQCVVELSSDLVGPVRERLSGRGVSGGAIEVIGNDKLDAMGCRVLTGEGVILADLDIQLQKLRERWGLASDTNEAEPD